MPGALIIGAGLALRLLSSRAPYGRAGIHFEPSPTRVYGVVEVAVEGLLDGALAQLLADPYVDVSVGPPGGAFLPVADLATFEEIAVYIAEALAGIDAEIETAISEEIETAISEMEKRHQIETSRDGGPHGDEEAPAAGSAAALAETPPPETPAPVDVAAFAAAARSPRGATIRVADKPKK